MNQEVSLLVFIEVQAGKAQSQIEAFKSLSPLVLLEDGCLQYELKRVVGSAISFIIIEKWSSKEALAAHEISSHMIEADSRNKSFRAKPATVIELTGELAI